MLRSIEQILENTGVQVPDLFLKMWQSGMIEFGHRDYIELTDTRWAPIDEVARRSPPPNRIHSLAPFALTGRGDFWAWYAEWRTDQGIAVIYCPRDESVGEGYAANLVGTVYRLLLEEFSSSWLVGRLVDTPKQLPEVFRRYSDIVSGFLPPNWCSNLAQLSRRDVMMIEEGVFGVMTREESQEIIRRDLYFAMLDRKVRISL
ncbi:MAG TPA: hypothetical protein VFE47_09685 [Tepidisphaeraceae bacterium]|jgi:hypothetical protein|nr:hypothetical protein [Tepidisphaeraceae bacterium]